MQSMSLSVARRRKGKFYKVIHSFRSFILLFSILIFSSHSQSFYSYVFLQQAQQPLSQKLNADPLIVVSSWQDMKANKEIVIKKMKNTQFELILTDIEKEPLYSTGDIVKALREQASTVNLVCFGKAAADCLEMFLQFPEMSKKVKAFISYEGKISGAEYAERAPEPLKSQNVEKAAKIPLSIAFEYLFEALLSWWHGFDPGLYSMKPSVRRAYLERYQDDIERLSEKVEIISIDTSRKQYGKIPFSTVLSGNF